MTREEAHKLVDSLFDAENSIDTAGSSNTGDSEPEAPKRVLPEGKRVVRTDSTGDRVYLLVEETMTRHWITNPEVLDSLGFEINDVIKITDDEMIRYQVGTPKYDGDDS